MPDNTNNKWTWTSIALTAMVFAGYRAITGSSMTHDIARKLGGKTERNQPIIQSRSQPSSTPEVLTQAPPIAQNSDKGPSQNISGLQEKAIGFLAQTMCSARLYDYTREQVSQKIDYFIEAYQAPSSLREWMGEPRVVSVASKLSMASSPNCNSFNLDSSDAQEAFKMMDRL